MFRAQNEHATGSILLNAYDQNPLLTISQKGSEKYNCNHVNIATYVNRFRLSEKLEHGKTDNK